MLKPGKRKLFSRFKSGVQKVYIETGRWKKISRDERICRFCESGKIENEDHVLWICDNFQRQRQLMFDQCKKMNMDEELSKKAVSV